MHICYITKEYRIKAQIRGILCAEVLRRLSRLTVTADGGELMRPSPGGRMVEERRRSGGNSATTDRRSSGEETPDRAKLAEGVGFDDVHHLQNWREIWVLGELRKQRSRY